MSISDISEIPDVKDIPEIPGDSKPVDLETRPSTSNENERSDLPLYRTERIIGSLTVAWVIILTTYMLFQNGELSYTSVYFLKIILSLSGAVMLATLPGFFDVSYNLSGFSVRAAGGAAAFVFIYTQSPNIPVIDKFQKSTSPPIEQEQQQPREKQNNEKLSVLNDEYPVLFVLSVSPASFAPLFFQPQPVSYAGNSGDWTFDDWPGQQQASVGASFMGGASSAIATIVDYLQAGLAYAKSALDATASTVRGVVDGIIQTAKSLLGLQSGTTPALNLFSETTAQDGLITGALLGSDDGLTGSLFTAVDLVNSLALGGLGETLETVILLTDTTVDPVIHLLDDTTTELVSTVHGTTDHVLYSADRLLGIATGTLDRLTGGLTQPVGHLAHGTIGKVVMLTDAVLPATADTVSKVLGGVEGGLDRITGSLNEISPKLISRFDPEYAAAAESSGNGLADGVTGLANKILVETHMLVMPDESGGGLLGAPLHELTSAPLLGDLPDRQRSPFADGPTCIAGCGADGETPAGLLNGGLNRTVSGLTNGLGNIGGGGNNGSLLGIGGGPGGGGPEGPAGGPGNSGHQGGLISSTLKNTGSLLGNTLGKLKKK
jgi:hypothetical protein